MKFTRTQQTFASVAVFGVIIVAALAFYVVSAPPPSVAPSATVETVTTAYTPTRALSNYNLSLSSFIQLIESDYFGGSPFGVLPTCTVVTIHDVGFAIPPSQLLGDSLYVRSGTAQICPVSDGITFDFAGTAVAGNVTITRLTMEFSDQQAPAK
jgi:hypothetical protein